MGRVEAQRQHGQTQRELPENAAMYGTKEKIHKGVYEENKAILGFPKKITGMSTKTREAIFQGKIGDIINNLWKIVYNTPESCFKRGKIIEIQEEIRVRISESYIHIPSNTKAFITEMKNPNEENILDTECERLEQLKNIAGIPQLLLHIRGNLTNAGIALIEHISGQDLEEYMRKNEKIDKKNTLRIMVRILEILNNVHKKGLSHNDIKTGNIMAAQNENGEIESESIHLIDFSPEAPEILSNLYAAPERFDYNYPEFGPKGDIYSTGIVFLELLLGKNPGKILIEEFGEEILEEFEPTDLAKCDKKQIKEIKESVIGPDFLDYLEKSQNPKIVCLRKEEILWPIILTILDPNPSNRSSAEQLIKTLNKLLEERYKKAA